MLKEHKLLPFIPGSRVLDTRHKQPLEIELDDQVEFRLKLGFGRVKINDELFLEVFQKDNREVIIGVLTDRNFTVNSERDRNNGKWRVSSEEPDGKYSICPVRVNTIYRNRYIYVGGRYVIKFTDTDEDRFCRLLVSSVENMVIVEEPLELGALAKQKNEFVEAQQAA